MPRDTTYIFQLSEEEIRSCKTRCKTYYQLGLSKAQTKVIKIADVVEDHETYIEIAKLLLYRPSLTEKQV